MRVHPQTARETPPRDSRRWRWLIAWVVLAWPAALWAAQHPIPLEKGTDTDCLGCHDDKSRGASVHTAIQMGCASCHDVRNEGGETKVSLTQPSDQLCFTCHEKSPDKFQHLPYDRGSCVICHDPHASKFRLQLRAPGNEICLACHARRPASGPEVVLFASQRISRTQLEAFPKLELDPTEEVGHPYAGHPVAGRSDHVKGEVSCLSCHAHHASPAAALIRMDSRADADLLNNDSMPITPCAQCHTNFRWPRQCFPNSLKCLGKMTQYP